MITLLIALYEGQEFIRFDVPGDFLQGKLDDDKHIILKLKGNRVIDMMYEINTKHLPNVSYEGKTKYYI